MVARAHVDGGVDDALVGDLQRALDLPVDEVPDGARAGRGQALLRQVAAQRQLGRRHLRHTQRYTRSRPAPRASRRPEPHLSVVGRRLERAQPLVRVALASQLAPRARQPAAAVLRPVRPVGPV